MPPVPDRRLQALKLQRALIARHLAWLDAEIRAAQAPSDVTIAPPTEPLEVIRIPGEVREGADSVEPTDELLPTTDRLLERLRAEEHARRPRLSKTGCWIWFALALIGALGAISVWIGWAYAGG